MINYKGQIETFKANFVSFKDFFHLAALDKTFELSNLLRRFRTSGHLETAKRRPGLRPTAITSACPQCE